MRRELPHADNVRKSSHCAWQIHDHLVFPVKSRKRLLGGEVTKMMKETAVSIGKRYPIEIEPLHTDKNHIYVLCSGHPKVAPGRIVQLFKRLTAERSFDGSQPSSVSYGASVLVGWIGRDHDWRAWKLADGGT